MKITAAKAPKCEVSHNQAGQRLGRKGQETREKVLSAILRLFADPNGPPVNLTNVAAEASVRLTNLYLYFPDFEELFLAALTRVMDTAEEGFVHLLRHRWPDEALYESALSFLQAHFDFWQRHARLLHMRNRLSDDDPRILQHRLRTTAPMLELLESQMDVLAIQHDPRWHIRAIVLLTGLERMATVATTPSFNAFTRIGIAGSADPLVTLMATEARLIELMIADTRAIARSAA